MIDLWFLLLLPALSLVIALICVLIYIDFRKLNFKRIMTIIFRPDYVVNKEIENDTNLKQQRKALQSEDTVDGQLDSDAHVYAHRIWCDHNGFGYDTVSNKCIIRNKNQCLSKSYKGKRPSNPYDANTPPLLVWSNGNCFESRGNNNLCVDRCIPRSETDTSCARNIHLGFELIPPDDIECDAEGNCASKSGGYDTCDIPKSYCNKRGMDFRKVDGLGDCHLTSAQRVTELVLGTTFTRQYKIAGQKLISDCQNDGPLSEACLTSSAVILSIGYRVTWDAYYARLTQSIDQFRHDCVNNKVSNGQEVMNCLQSTHELFPGYWLTRQGVDLLRNMLRLSGLFPDKDLDYVSMNSIAIYGGKALDAIYSFGNDAGEAIARSGNKAIRAIEKVLTTDSNDPFVFNSFDDDNLSDFTTITNIPLKNNAVFAILSTVHLGNSAADAIIKYGSDGSIIIWKTFEHFGSFDAKSFATVMSMSTLDHVDDLINSMLRRFEKDVIENFANLLIDVYDSYNQVKELGKKIIKLI